MTLANIHERLRESAGADLPALRVVVLQNITADPLEPYLRQEALEAGFAATLRFGRFDAIVQQAADKDDPIWSEPADVVLVFSALETLSPLLARRFPSLERSQIDREVERIDRFLELAIGGLRSHSRAMLLWHGFETPPHPALGILDAQTQLGQTAAIRRLNNLLQERLSATDNAYFVDMDRIMARVGADGFYDRRYWHIARAAYGRAGLAELAREQMRFVRAARGKSRKCLVLDCDNTLWGGIVGEDGLASIQISPDHPGSTYYEFQQEVLSLHERGVILALCSKNNEADVWEVFHQRSEMILQEHHISAAQINWDDKVTNLRRIAEDLNIGTDSFVFVDDSEFEIQMVRKMLPEVVTIHLPAARAAEARDVLAGCGYFDSLVFSTEDRIRGQMYKAEAQRRGLRSTSVDLASYLASLEICVCIQQLDELTLPRASQLTQRTNQFNLTTRRYSESDIRAFHESADDDVMILRVTDRFGDYGVVGVAILHHDQGSTQIDSFLMSCRVIGRGVEEALLYACLDFARRRSSQVVHGRYVPTAKNTLVRSFLGNCGFDLVRELDGELQYGRDMSRPIPKMPPHLKAVDVQMPESLE